MPDPLGQSPPKVLIVEDGSGASPRLADLLQGHGYDLLVLRDPDEALARLEQDAPHCVLVDVTAPHVDGLAMCRRVKSAEPTRLLPVVLVGGALALEDKLSALEAGADDVVGRPLEAREMAARVRSLVRLRQSTLALESAQNVIFALATAIEQKDDYTEGHGERVAVFARSLAEHVGLSAEEVEQVYMGGILHDVGKIGCPDAILNKPGPLTPDEFEIIKRHPVHGWEICRHLKSLGDCTLCCIRNHHERLDGSGYPDGLAGDAVPITTRIMSIADVFDALATARAYKPAFPTETCFKILREEAERGWWDKQLVEAFVDVMKLKELDQPLNRKKLDGLFRRPPPPPVNGNGE